MRARILAAACGVLGAVTLVTSFVINPAPPAGATVVQLAEFASRHRHTIVLGGWLQGIGSLLLVLFAIALVHLAGAAQRFAGWITLLAGAVILMVSLVEITFYLAAVEALAKGDPALGTVVDVLIKAVQHVFLIAPALLLPLSVVLLGSRVLPRAFGYLAAALGATLQTLGLLGLLHPLQPVIDVLLIVQALWFVTAAVALVVQGPGPARRSSLA